MKRLLLPISIAVIMLIAGGFLVWYFVSPPGEALTSAPGKISGSTSYPSDTVPALRVCAESIADGRTVKCVDLEAQADAKAPVPTFSLEVPPGKYFVYATLINPADLGLEDAGRAYYSKYVTCGLKYECKDHTKIEIDVSPEQEIKDVIVADWYQ